MIRGLAITAGALAGVFVTALGKRAHRDAGERGVGLRSAVTSLPRTLRSDAGGLKDDAKAAVDDGRAAGATRKREVSESIDAALRTSAG
jgi:hypothetical protein